MRDGSLRAAAVVIAYMVWMGVDEMNLDTLSPFILSLVTFIPAGGRVADSADSAARTRH